MDLEIKFISFVLNGISTLLIMFLMYIINGLRLDIRDIRINIVKHISDYSIHRKAE